MTSDNDANLPAWLDDQQPHDAAYAEDQLAILLSLLEPGSKRVLDLGCGAGRILHPLVEAGHHLVGIDRDEAALEACRVGLGSPSSMPQLVLGDFLHGNWPEGPYDAVLCLGNTFMTIDRIEEAVGLLQRAASVLTADGIFIIDDLPGDFWPELTEGNWQAGIAEDGSAQMIWDPRDCVFALRSGGAVDGDSWTFKSSDQRFRLWTAGALNLACHVAGLSEPVVHPGLLVMKRA